MHVDVYGDGMNMELLQLATLLIRRAPQQLIQHRKELIKFGWNHLKRDDSAAKYYAFLNVCHFLEAYQAPEKIVLQVGHRYCPCNSLASYRNPDCAIRYFGQVAMLGH